MSLKKIIIVRLIVLMLESIAGYIYLTYFKETPAKQPKLTALNVPSPAPEVPGTEVKHAALALKTDSVIIKRGSSFKVDVVLDTFSSESSAADLTLKYDPAVLTIVATDSAKPFSDSKIFERTVFNSLNTRQGVATMSAVSEVGKSFSGNQILTSLTFRALKAGQAEITIVFTPGETRDTNVVSETEDILSKVEGLSLEIQP